MDTRIMDDWYINLADHYGEDFCIKAGYFEETKPFVGSYAAEFVLPENRTVIQFSGAFHPFHNGHLEMLQNAIAYLPEKPFVVLHADHAEYRETKGNCPLGHFISSFMLMHSLNVDWVLVREDIMPESCSRNFTRLYSELQNRGNNVYFLCGGDRANFALTFIDDGACIVSGRDQADMYEKYSYLSDNRRIIFLAGNNSSSSTEERRRL